MSQKKSLPVRKTADSEINKIMPFSKDKELRERYINFFGALRLGKLLEDLDLIAGQVAYKHTEGWEHGLTIVTAACANCVQLDDADHDCVRSATAAGEDTPPCRHKLQQQVAAPSSPG